MARTGRPSTYKPEYCDMLIEHMSKGGSIIEFCGEIQVGESTIYEWFQKYEDFSESKKVGEVLSEAWWRREARESLRDKDFNSTLWYMNMKNRFKWSDRQQVDHTTKGDKLESVSVTIVDPDEGE